MLAIRIESEARTHLIEFPRRCVEQLERRATCQLRKATGDQRALLLIARTRFRATLAEQKGNRLAIAGQGNWFAWLCEVLGDWEIGFYVGRSLQGNG